MERLDFAELGSVDERGLVRLKLDGRIVKGQLVDVFHNPEAHQRFGIVQVDGDPSGQMRACYYRLADSEEMPAELAPIAIDFERAVLVVYEEQKHLKAS